MGKTNVILGFLRTILLFATGKVYFYNENIGKEITEFGQNFKVFRHVKIKPALHDHVPKAIFKITFNPANMGVEENKRFSIIPMMIFMGFKGFRSKYWAVDENTGQCLGFYEWDTLEDAQNYSKSIALKFMNRRSIPGSVKYEIIPK